MPKPWYVELYEHFPNYDQEPYTQGTQGEVDFIEQEIGHDRSKVILDVGCGTGRHALELARRGYKVVGLDLSESLLERGRQVARAEKSTNGKFILAEGASHYLYLDAPELVAESILAVVYEVRAK